MGMFLNYQSISDNYVPNNLICSFPVGKSYTKLDPVEAGKPYEEYNVKGELVGYFWRYGETLNLEFNIDGEITIENDAIVLTSKGQKPSIYEGYINQRCYNIADLTSWTCTSIVNDTRNWSQDNEFTYPDTDTSVYISANDYLRDKSVTVSLYNFRLEQLASATYAGQSKIIFPITRDLSKKLTRGIYYCSVTVENDSTCLSVFDTKDCVLIVK